MAKVAVDEELIKRIGKLANKSKEQLYALDLIMTGMAIQKQINAQKCTPSSA